MRSQLEDHGFWLGSSLGHMGSSLNLRCMVSISYQLGFEWFMYNRKSKIIVAGTQGTLPGKNSQVVYNTKLTNRFHEFIVK